MTAEWNSSPLLRSAILASLLCAILGACVVFGFPAVAHGDEGEFGANFGFASVGFAATEQPTAEQAARKEPGAPDVRAGSHPWALTTSFFVDTIAKAGPPAEGKLIPDADVKDLQVELPPGLVGNATIMQACETKAFNIFRESATNPENLGEFDGASFGRSNNECPADTQVGAGTVELRNPGLGENDPEFLAVPVYNLVPPPGTPAEFGFKVENITVLLRPTVRTGGDFGLTVSVGNISQLTRIGGTSLSFWGVPADPSHDAERRGYGCRMEAGCPAGVRSGPFLTLPTSCTSEPLRVGFVADDWQDPGSYNADGTPNLSDPAWKQATATLPAMTGCDRPAFGPSLTAAPDTVASDSPAGLTADVKVGQEGLVIAGGIATAAVENTTVTLPPGMAINPGQAAGLAACRPGEDGVGSESPASCPSASRVGTVEIATPLLRDKLEGDVYVLQSNPPNLQLLIVASADGVSLKLPAQVHLDEATGRVTTTLLGTPPLPFTDFNLKFSGGAQAALVTPPTCGMYTTNGDFVPWSSPFELDSSIATSFGISTGPAGSGPAGCTGPLPFNPVLTAGATTDQAGGFTDFSLLLQRADGQQRIQSLQFKAPPGLLGMISKIPLCPEPQASEGTCPVASQIGHTIVTAGPGPYPLVVPQPGQPPAAIYLTGAYKGAPYGLSIVVPLVVGPFVLQTQVVRASIAVDPRTAQLTITTDHIPAIVDGIPTDLRSIDAVVDREGFIFNPTNCNPSSFSGTAASTEGVTAGISTHFQVGSCQSLAFKPAFKVSTAGATSKRDGASLTATLTNPTTVPGHDQATSESGLQSLKIDLPKQLPSRLTTLQKACLAIVFNANPAACPAASILGRVTVHTPVLPVPLTGPAYFVSNGGEAFPNFVMVLQGYGVTIEIVGQTFISKAGVTSLTFKTIPDAPFNTFTVTTPEGPYSALAANLPAKANGDFCGQKLTMPTVFNAQDGAVIHQSTPVGVTGCPKAKKAAKPKRKAKRASTHRTTGANDKGRE